MKILVIEDDRTLLTNVAQALRQDGMAVDEAGTAEAALVAVEVNSYDCIVLDLGLPDDSGFKVLKTWRAAHIQTPVMIMTARGLVEDRVKGLNAGADDYVPKPVATVELIARIRALIRRNSATALPVITVKDLTVKPAEHYAAVLTNELQLTAKEFGVLEYMAQHQGEMVTRTMLMEHLWGSDFDTFSNVVDVYIKNIRKEISRYTQAHYIQTIRGKGYILKTD